MRVAKFAASRLDPKTTSAHFAIGLPCQTDGKVGRPDRRACAVLDDGAMRSGCLELLLSSSQRAGSSPIGPRPRPRRAGALRPCQRRGSRARSRRDTPAPDDPYILAEASTFKSPMNRCCPEKALSNDWQKPNLAEASEPVSKAREAAERTFTMGRLFWEVPRIGINGDRVMSHRFDRSGDTTGSDLPSTT